MFTISEFIIEVIQRIPANRLVQWKRHCIKNLVNSKMFCLSECRAILLPVFCQQIKYRLNINDEVSPKMPTKSDSVCVCCMLNVPCCFPLCVSRPHVILCLFVFYVLLVHVL